MMKSRENAQKPVFPAYFQHFRLKKSFYKVGLRHFLGIAILHLCAKNQQKIMSQSREKQEIGKWSKGISPKTKIRNLQRKKVFREIFFGHILGYLALYLSAKNQKKLMKQFCTKSKKPYF